MTEAGHGAQVVKVLDDHTYQLDEAELGSVLLRDDIKDLPVVVVSVAGAFRHGKSFLLNFFLRYLTSPESARTDGSWLGEDSEPLKGFSWRSGTKRNTTGILLWSEPIILDMPTGNTKQKVAVLLMDTQGTFDSESTVRDCSTIFALSTLLSSVQIYNLMTQIQEDDLQHLQLFTEYGRMVKDQEGVKAFQVLKFLVRDWPNADEHRYGAAGGENYLNQCLAITPRMPQELKDLRKHIKACFEKVTCFLMPHPGLKVIKKTFTGKISDIEPDFKIYLIELVASLFDPEKLTPKYINGDIIRAKNLFTYFKAYMNIFNSNKTPHISSIFEATVEAGMLTAVNEARAVYEDGMDAECGLKQPSCMPGRDVQDLHVKYLALARAEFSKKKKMGKELDATNYLEKLTQELEEQLPVYQKINMAKSLELVNKATKAYDQAIYNISKGQLLCVHPMDLRKVHKEAFAAAQKLFDDFRKHLSNEPDLEREEFLKGFENRYALLQIQNNQNNNTVVIQLREEYYNYMEVKSNIDPPLSEIELKNEHDKALKKALDDFEAKRNRPNSYLDDPIKFSLTEKILKNFANIKIINKSKNKTAMQAGIRAYEAYMRGAWDASSVFLHVSDLDAEHQSGKCRALLAFRPNKSCYEGFDNDDSDERALLDMINDSYGEIKKKNDQFSQKEVQAAFNHYCNTMVELCRPTVYCLRTEYKHKSEKIKYHEKTKSEAINLFKKKQRSNSYVSDPYVDSLVQMMNNKFNSY